MHWRQDDIRAAYATVNGEPLHTDYQIHFMVTVKSRSVCKSEEEAPRRIG